MVKRMTILQNDVSTDCAVRHSYCSSTCDDSSCRVDENPIFTGDGAAVVPARDPAPVVRCPRAAPPSISCARGGRTHARARWLLVVAV
eukprot:2164681-Pleurochrysis_carterae.AAC.3